MLQIWFFSNSILWPFHIELFGLKLWLNVVVLLIAGAIWFIRKPGSSLFSSISLFAVLAYLSISILVAISGPCTDKFEKLLITLPILLILIFEGFEIGWRSGELDWLKLQKTATLILLVAFSGFLVEMMFPDYFPVQIGYRMDGKFSGVFAEPSHVAFSLFPSIAILLIAENKRHQRNGIIALLIILILSRSSTLFVLIVAWVLYRLIAKRKFLYGILFGICLAFIVLLLSALDYDLLIAPTLDRISGVLHVEDSSVNFSSLVYLQGWQDAWSIFDRTNGLGLGFNMMGCSPLPDVPARKSIYNAFKMGLNDEDGSFFASKLISETGVIGILLIIAITLWFLFLERKISVHVREVKYTAVAIPSALIFLFLATTFVRSGGYFHPGFLLLVIAVAASIKWCNSLKSSKLKLEIKISPNDTQLESNMIKKGQQTANQEINFEDVLIFLKRKKITIAIFGASGLLLSILYNTLSSPKYEATLQLQMAQYIESNRSIISIEPPKTLIQRLRLPSNYSATVLRDCDKSAEKELGDYLDKMIEIREISSSIAELKLYVRSPVQAKQCAEALVAMIALQQHNFIEDRLAGRAEQLTNYQQSLKEEKQQIENIKNAGIANIEYLARMDNMNLLRTQIGAIQEEILLSQKQPAKLIVPLFVREKHLLVGSIFLIILGLWIGMIVGILYSLVCERGIKPQADGAIDPVK